MAKKTNAIRLVETSGTAFEVRSYDLGDAAFSAGAVADALDLSPRRVFKTLLARGERTGPCFAVVPADVDLDLKALARAAGDRRAGPRATAGGRTAHRLPTRRRDGARREEGVSGLGGSVRGGARDDGRVRGREGPPDPPRSGRLPVAHPRRPGPARASSVRVRGGRRRSLQCPESGERVRSRGGRACVGAEVSSPCWRERCSCCPAFELSADEAKGDAEAFAIAIDRIYESCRKESFASAERSLESLLKKHARGPYALARRLELEDLAERIAYGASCQAPEIDDVLSGKVEKWDPVSGDLKVRYTTATDGDLASEQGGWRRLPAAVAGSFWLEVEGRDYPSRSGVVPRMMFGGGACPRSKRPQSWLVVFGTPQEDLGSRTGWVPARVVHFDGDREKVLDEEDKIPISAGKPFTLQLKVTKNRITAGINGKTVLKARRSPGTWGLAGFDVKNWEKVTFSGTVEPAWIQDRLDAVAQAQLKAFRKTYERTRFLPKWLFDGIQAAPATRGKRPTLPVELDRRLRSPLSRLEARMKRRDLPGALEALEQLEKGGAPASVLAYFRARLNAGVGLLPESLAQIDACLEDAPAFLEGQLLKAAVLRQLGQDEAAYRTLQDAIEGHPKVPDAYEAAAIAMLYAARPEVAQAVADRAVASGVSSPTLDLVGRMIVKSRRGPMWNKTFEYKSRNYHVLSDISKQTCVEAASLLEEALVSYRVNLEWVSHEKDRLYPVYLFRGREGFGEYMQEFSALVGKVPDQVAGLYNPLLKQLCIWHLPKRDVMLEVIRHEGFHQYLDRLMPSPPIWFNEGLAVYHEKVEKKRGKLHFGGPHPTYLTFLSKRELVPLKEFLHWSREEFYGAAPYSYAQAWALMHLLKEGTSEQRALFQALLDEFQAQAAVEVIRAHFPEASLPALETELQAHIRGLGKR